MKKHRGRHMKRKTLLQFLQTKFRQLLLKSWTHHFLYESEADTLEPKHSPEVWFNKICWRMKQWGLRFTQQVERYDHTKV